MAHGASIGVGASGDFDGGFDGVGLDFGGVGFNCHASCGDLGHSTHDGTHEGVIFSHCEPASNFETAQQGALQSRVQGSFTEGNRQFSMAVVGHGQVDIVALLKDLTDRFELVERVGGTGSERKLNLQFQELQPIPGSESMPAGFVGGTGMTKVWRCFYSIGTNDWFGKLRGLKPSLDRSVNTRIKVTVVQWYHGATADYETHFVVSVASPKSIYDRQTRSYCYRVSELDSHRQVAAHMASRLASALTEAKPSDYSRLLRGRKVMQAVAA